MGLVHCSLSVTVTSYLTPTVNRLVTTVIILTTIVYKLYIPEIYLQHFFLLLYTAKYVSNVK